MIGSILKAVAYSQAPRTTFAALHPKEAARLKKFEWDMKHAYAPRVTALGVAFIALPLGMLIGRLTAPRHAESHRGPRVNPNARRTGWPDEVSARMGTRGYGEPTGYETDAPRAAAREPARPARPSTTAGSTVSGTAPTTSPLGPESTDRPHRG